MTKVFPKDWLKSKPEKEIHLMSIKELQSKFQVDISRGLSSKKAAELLEINRRKSKLFPKSLLFKKIALGLTDFFSILLWISIVLFVILYVPLKDPFTDISNLINIVIISFILISKAIIICLQEYNSSKLAKSLHSNDMTPVSVLRDSTWSKIPACELVVGDVVEIRSNDRVPADLRLVLAKNLTLDNSILTGENEPIEASVNSFENVDSKLSLQEAKNIALRNFLVLSGYGQGIVISNGLDNVLDESEKYSKNFENPIFKALNQIAFIVVLMCIVSEIIYLVVWFSYLRPNFYTNPTFVWRNILNMAVTGIPVGLPVALLLSLFVIFLRLRKLNIMVKNVFVIKSMNCVNVVITDKTGTLTRNSVEIANVFYSTKEICVDLCYESPEVYLGAQKGLRELIDLCDFCMPDSYTPNMVERALYDFAARNRPSSKKIINEYEIIDEIGFNSNNKYQVRLVRPRLHNKYLLSYNNKSNEELECLVDMHCVLLIRGAPDILLSKCKRMIKPNGECAPIDEKSLREIETKIDQWSFMARRLIFLCKKILTDEHSNGSNLSSNKDFQAWFNTEFNDLIYVGMVGFIDPPKPEINESVLKIRDMGVRVVMLTGDYSITAASVAMQTGILTNLEYDTYAKFHQNILSQKFPRKAIILKGQEIERLSEEEWKLMIREYSEIVLSRASPNHKLICVKEFQKSGFSVLMVGDGVNDVPALKQADISVAMNSGSKLAADVSGVVITNGSFNAIYDLISFGRQTLVNTKKAFLFYSVSSMFSQWVASLVACTFGMPQLYSNLQMTIVSAVTDVVPSISFMFEKFEPNELKIHRENVINRQLLIIGFLFLGPLITLLAYMNFFLYFRFYTATNVSELFFRYFSGDDSTETVQVAQSIGFYSIVVMQTFGILYSIRTRRLLMIDSLPMFRPYRNRFLVITSIVTFILVVVLMVVRVPGITVKIPLVFYFTPLIYSLLIFVLNECRKVLINRYNFLESYLSW